MSSKTDTEVIIGGKVYTLSGYESEEYLQRVASYINNKVNEYSKIDSFRRQPLDTQNVLLQLNVADDYFKAKRQIALLEDELQAKEKELYDLKHELISCQIKLENAENNAKKLKQELKAANERRDSDFAVRQNDKSNTPDKADFPGTSSIEANSEETNSEKAESTEKLSADAAKDAGQADAKSADSGSNDFKSSDPKSNDSRNNDLKNTNFRNNSQKNQKNNRNNYQKSHS